MSIIYCEKHDIRWDSDKLEACPRCNTGHTTEDDYQHFVSYSGLEHSATLRYAYFHGAGAAAELERKP